MRCVMLNMRRFLPGCGFGRMTELTSTESVGTVLAGRIGLAGNGPLESLELDVIQSHVGRRFRVRRPMTGLALDAALVAAAVYELAEEARVGRVRGSAHVFVGVTRESRRNAGCGADTGRQRGRLPGLGQLARGNALVQVAVAIIAVDAGIGGLVGAAITVDAVARMALIAVRGNKGIILREHKRIFDVISVHHVGEGVLGDFQVSLREARSRKYL